MPAAADPPADGLVPRPAAGRIFEEARRVRLADVDPAGRVRLDATTRYLQDLSADDTADAALEEAEAWVVRKTVIEVRKVPRYLEALELATWCAGIGSHYAERRISIVGERGGAVEAATTWVHVDPRRGRPARVPAGFEDLYGEASGGRRITARLTHPDPPAAGVERSPWPLRATDFDVLAHVNNAAYWEAVEESLLDRGERRGPVRAELEHRRAVEPGAVVERLVAGEEGGLRVWLLADDVVAASAVVRSLSP